MTEVNQSNGVDTSKYLAVPHNDSPVILSWDNLVVATKTKTLLKGVRGQFCGGFWAIMGSSGSGKTTLLSTLAMRLNTGVMSVKGDMRINGREYTKHILKSMAGYVMQDDLLDGHFTVLETLQYTARLRMGSDTTAEERKTRINEVLRLLDILHVKDVYVGDTRRKGISGGERKRLCIAMELLPDPKLLFLDEPTSGLDSHNAMAVITILKKLADRNACTIVSTIHQPSSQVFGLFDSLLLMSRGRIIYQGAAPLVLSYFETIGFPCPENTNPADHIIFVAASDPALRKRRRADEDVDDEALEKAWRDEQVVVSHTDLTITDVESGSAPKSLEMVSLAKTSGTTAYAPISEDEGKEGIIAAVEEAAEVALVATQGPFQAEKNVFAMTVDMSMGEEKDAFLASNHKRLSWLSQWWVLFLRSIHSHLRKWDVLALNVVVTLVIAGFVCGSVWNDIGTTKSSGSRRQPALFFCVIHQGIVASLQGTHSFPLERALMLRERASGAYTVSAYFLGKTLADIVIMQLLPPILFTCVVYPTIGFAPSTDQFFMFMFFMILTSMAATSLANLAACLCVGVERATVLLAAAYEISRLYGAWFISPKLMSDYSDWRFADTLSYIKYSFVGVSLNEDLHLRLHCDPSELTKSTSSSGVVTYNCVIAPLNKAPYTGDAYNAYYGYDQYTIGGCIGALILYIFSCRLLAYLALRYIKM